MTKPMMDCPQCGTPMHYIPAGISKKTKKPYKAFFSCPECNFTMNVPDDIASDLPKTPVKATSQYQERVERMHKEKTDNINKGLAYKLATYLIQHSTFKDLKIAELKDQVDLLADWYLQQMTSPKLPTKTSYKEENLEDLEGDFGEEDA